jgi:hypothetical protein
MAIDIELIIGIVCALIAILREAQHRNVQAQIDEAAKDMADATAYIYDRSRRGELCNAETMKELNRKATEIWGDLALLGNSVQAILAQKSSLAESLQTKPEAGK